MYWKDLIQFAFPTCYDDRNSFFFFWVNCCSYFIIYMLSCHLHANIYVYMSICCQSAATRCFSIYFFLYPAFSPYVLFLHAPFPISFPWRPPLLHLTSAILNQFLSFNSAIYIFTTFQHVLYGTPKVQHRHNFPTIIHHNKNRKYVFLITFSLYIWQCYTFNMVRCLE